MTEREEFERFWANAAQNPMTPYLKPLAKVAWQAGRRSRQKQDAELCDAGGCPECRKDIEGTP